MFPSFGRLRLLRQWSGIVDVVQDSSPIIGATPVPGLYITCPWCGERPENEFHCGGTSHIQRPPLNCSDDTWGDYMFGRDNSRGPHAVSSVS